MVCRHWGICIDEPDPEDDQQTMDQPKSSEKPPTDFFPSVGLATLLALIFIPVGYVLFVEGGGRGRIVPLGFVGGKAVRIHPLISSQTRAAWWILEKSLKPNRDGVTTMIAISKDNTAQTLICFSSHVISLLSAQFFAHNVTRRLHESKSNVPLWYNKGGSSRNFHVAVITKRKGQSPHGVILGPGANLGEGESPWEMTLTVQQKESELSQHHEAYCLANKVMKLLYTSSGRVSETFEFGKNVEESIPILQITGDPYLESGFVC